MYSAEVYMLAIRLPEDVENRLASLAAKTGRTKTFYAKEAILEHLDDMEDKYLAINRLENLGKRWTLDALEQGSDLDN
jgi:RHH-type rel operon transcriptional repressor/antitoxin RelB